MRDRWLVFLFTVAACAHHLPPVPGKGGPAWHELASEHFILWTDLPEADAGRALRHLEGFRDVVSRFIFSGAARLPSKSLVIAFRSSDDWAHFGNPKVVGFFKPISESMLNVPYLAYEAERWDRNVDPRQIVQHELGHLAVHSLLEDPPAWLDEGIASFFETTVINDAVTVAEVGRMPETFSLRLAATRMPTVEHVVLKASGEDRHQPGFYLRSHVLVSYLMNREGQRFAAYQRALKEVPPGVEHHEAAWRRVFADGASSGMQTAMDHWLRTGRVTVLELPIPEREKVVLQTRPLGDADVHTIRALMYASFKEKREEALGSAAAAVEADPLHVVGNLIHALLTKNADPERVRLVAAEHPDDWRAWFLVALAAKEEKESAAALHRACEILEKDPTQRAPSTVCKGR
jgi:hypothetical protein